MCKEDVRIGRASVGRQVNLAAFGSGPGRILPGNGSRLALRLVVPSSAFGGATNNCIVGPMIDGAILPVLSTGPNWYVDEVKLEDIGDLVFLPMYCTFATDNTPAGSLVEVFLNSTLEAI